MSSVRDIIVEAASRANVCPRKRVLPDDIFVDSIMLFNGVMEEYSARDYIEAYKDEVDFKPHSEEVYVGERPSEHVDAPSLQLPKKVLYKYDGSVDWTPMEFIAYENFYSAAYSDYIVSWKPVGPNLYKLYFKPRFISNNPECKLIYNVEMKYADNDTVNLPTPYVELITRNLAYKMAVKWPRVDESKKNSLKDEMTELEHSLKATNASMHIITRGGYGQGGSLQSNLRSGAFISDRFF